MFSVSWAIRPIRAGVDEGGMRCSSGSGECYRSMSRWMRGMVSGIVRSQKIEDGRERRGEEK